MPITQLSTSAYGITEICDSHLTILNQGTIILFVTVAVFSRQPLSRLTFQEVFCLLTLLSNLKRILRVIFIQSGNQFRSMKQPKHSYVPLIKINLSFYAVLVSIVSRLFIDRLGVTWIYIFPSQKTKLAQDLCSYSSFRFSHTSSA